MHGLRNIELTPKYVFLFHSQTPNEDFCVEQSGRQNLLSTFIQYQSKIPHPVYGNRSGCVVSESGASASVDLPHADDFDNQGTSIRLLHEEIALQWGMAVGNAIDMAMANSWFLFELIVNVRTQLKIYFSFVNTKCRPFFLQQSMIEHLDATQTLNALRKNRFPPEYNLDLETLIGMVATKVVQSHGVDNKLAQSLNISLAFFIFDLLSIMDRGFVFGLIKSYYKLMASKIVTNPDLVHYKLDFLRIVCSHEHYVALNLPFATPYTMASASAPCSPTPSATSNNSQSSYLSTVVSVTDDEYI